MVLFEKTENKQKIGQGWFILLNEVPYILFKKLDPRREGECSCR